LGIGGALYISELLGAVLIFAGYWRAITPMGGDQTSGTEAGGEGLAA